MSKNQSSPISSPIQESISSQIKGRSYDKLGHSHISDRGSVEPDWCDVKARNHKAIYAYRTEATNDRAEEFEAKVRTLQKANEDLRAESALRAEALSSERRRAEGLEEKVRFYEAEIKKRLLDLRAGEHERKELLEDNNRKKAKIQEMKDALEAKEQALLQRTEQLRTAESESAIKHMENEKLIGKVRGMEDTISTFKRETEKLIQESAELNENLHSIRRNCEDLKLENRKLTTSLGLAKDEALQLKSLCDESRKESAKRKQDCIKLSEENSHLETEVKDLRKKLIQAKADLDQSLAIQSSTASQSNELVEDVSKLKEASNGLAFEMAKIEGFVRDTADLEDRLKEVYSILLNETNSQPTYLQKPIKLKSSTSSIKS